MQILDISNIFGFYDNEVLDVDAVDEGNKDDDESLRVWGEGERGSETWFFLIQFFL